MDKFYKLDVLDKPDPQIAVCAIEKLCGENFVKYCDDKLFQPLQIRDYSWHTDMDNIQDMEMTTKLILIELHKRKGSSRSAF